MTATLRANRYPDAGFYTHAPGRLARWPRFLKASMVRSAAEIADFFAIYHGEKGRRRTRMGLERRRRTRPQS